MEAKSDRYSVRVIFNSFGDCFTSCCRSPNGNELHSFNSYGARKFPRIGYLGDLRIAPTSFLYRLVLLLCRTRNDPLQSTLRCNISSSQLGTFIFPNTVSFYDPGLMISFEEKYLMSFFPEYEEYRKHTYILIPFLPNSKS